MDVHLEYRDKCGLLGSGETAVADKLEMQHSLTCKQTVIGRFITFSAEEYNQAGPVSYNFTQTGVLGDLWNSSTLVNVSETLLAKTATSANMGDLIGNRMYYNNDYMVCIFSPISADQLSYSFDRCSGGLGMLQL